MARQSAEYIRGLQRPVSTLIASPLQRARESAEPFEELFGLDPSIDERVIEPTNVFEGRRMQRVLANPVNWRHLSRPAVPSWGEAYERIIARMLEAMDEAWDHASGGDVVVVSHQLPIWITHLSVAGQAMRHDPRRRRCALSSVTSFERRGARWVEVAYAEPASTAGAVDVGAV